MNGQNFFRGLVVVLLVGIVAICGGCASKQYILKTVRESEEFASKGEFDAHVEKAVPVLEDLTKRVKTAEGTIEKNSNSITRLETYTGIPREYPDCNIPTLSDRLDALASDITAYQNNNAAHITGIETRVQALEQKPAPKPVIVRDSSWSSQYALSTAEAVVEREQQLCKIYSAGELKFTYFYGYGYGKTEMDAQIQTELREMINSHMDPNDTSSPLFRDMYYPIQISGITSADGPPAKNREINLARAADAIAQLNANGIDTSELEPQFGGYKRNKRGFLIVWKKQ